MPLGAGHDGFADCPGANELQQEVALGIGAERQARLEDLANCVAGRFGDGLGILDRRGHRRFAIDMLAGL